MDVIEIIKQVLALFDDDDIPYIQVGIVKKIINNGENKPKIKKIGGLNERK